MKTVLFNSFFLACLYSCIFMLPACESGNASSPDDNGQQDVYEDESTTTDNTADVNPPDEVDPLDEVDPPDELVVDTEPEADVGEDPLEEYYWLEGEWECIEATGGCMDDTIEISLVKWNEENGVEVHGISPLNVSFIKKNPESSEFELFVEYESGSWAEGIANPETLAIEFDYHNMMDGNTYHIKYEKM